MRSTYSGIAVLVASVMSMSALAGCAAAETPAPTPTPASAPAAADRWSYQDWPTGHYRVVENWPKPLPDTRHSHAGWTWGSFGGVYAESPDRIWVAMRGELPLPEGRQALDAVRCARSHPRQHDGQHRRLSPRPASRPTNADGSAGSSIRSSSWTGKATWWTSGRIMDELFSKLPCGRGPHQIKISPYDNEKHVWIFDDQLHVIYKFTYDGKLVHTHGQLGVRGRGPNTFDRPTDIAWLPDGTYFITDGYGGTRVAKFDANDKFIMDWGGPPKDPAEPGPERVEHRPQHRDQRRPPALRRGPRTPADAGLRRERQVPRHVDAPIAQLAGQPGDAHGQPPHRRQGIHLGRRRADGADAQVRSEREPLVQLGRSRRAGRTARLLARHHDRSARQPVPRRLLHGTGAEIRADPRRARGEARGTDHSGRGIHGSVPTDEPVGARP